MPQLPSFARLDQRLTAAVTQRLANALVQVVPDGPHWAAMHDHALPEASPFVEVASVGVHTVTMCTTGVGELAEGGLIVLTTAAWPAGRACRVASPVVPDQSGWATFDVVPEG